MLIKFKEEVKEFESGASLFEIAKAFSDKLEKKPLAAKINDTVLELRTTLNTDTTIEFITFDDEIGKEIYRHSCAHIMAQAVKHLYPDTKITIGPAIDNGFYYDFDFATTISKDALDKIEAEMKKIIKANYPIVRKEVTKEEALKFFKDEPYKVELIENLPEGSIISTYSQDDFTDICRGPHVPSTGYIKAYKLTSVTGAYWRGDE